MANYKRPSQGAILNLSPALRWPAAVLRLLGAGPIPLKRCYATNPLSSPAEVLKLPAEVHRLLGAGPIPLKPYCATHPLFLPTRVCGLYPQALFLFLDLVYPSLATSCKKF